jgi:hypothetical protein
MKLVLIIEISNFIIFWLGSKVVMQEPAKLLYAGSIPALASTCTIIIFLALKKCLEIVCKSRFAKTKLLYRQKFSSFIKLKSFDK